MKRVITVKVTATTAVLILVVITAACIFVTQEAYAATKLNSSKSNIYKVTDTNNQRNTEETVLNQQQTAEQHQDVSIDASGSESASITVSSTLEQNAEGSLSKGPPVE
jgi:hypothetical protein